MKNMTAIRLGGTIALPNYSNIKVEVEGNSFSHTKALLRLTLENLHNEFTAIPIEGWWRTTFNEDW